MIEKSGQLLEVGALARVRLHGCQRNAASSFSHPLRNVAHLLSLRMSAMECRMVISDSLLPMLEAVCRQNDLNRLVPRIDGE